MVEIYSPRKHRKHRLLGWISGSTFGVLVVAGVWNAYALVRDLPNPERIADRAVVESTKIFDRSGTVLLYEIHGEERRTIIPLAEMPEHVIAATLAAEDLNFYHHAGLDVRGILRALVQNLRRGNLSQGGSTITQQLIKNSLLGSEKTFTRKIREQILALLLERKYSKDQILELYLNQIPYGSNAYGIAAASDTYFSKHPRDLSLAEAATLAALPKAPTYYSPYGSRKEDLLARRNWILDRMAESGFAPRAETDRAKASALSAAPPRQGIRAPHFVLFVREYLNQKFGEEFVERGGLRVVTTLDWKLQEVGERVVREGAERNRRSVQAHNAALVALDPKTGDILAMVGSKDYFAKPEPENCTPGVSCRFDPNVNVATRLRQPGSAFKPFVYATAFKKGYTTETVLFDTPTEFNPNCNLDGTPGPLVRDPKDCYHPQDYDGKFRGPVTLRQALAQSLNVPSVKLLYLAGIPDSIQTATELGISSLTEPDRYGLSLVLGGAEVSLLEMVSGFGVFAQEGILRPKTAILRIENAHGVKLEEKKDVSLPVLDTEIARTINDVLSDNDARVPVFSPQSALHFPGRHVAAKTGTTQESRDAWVIGYTPSFVAGVWVGNNDNTAMHRSSLSVMVAAPIWREFMDAAIESHPPEGFTPSDKRVPEKPTLRGHYRAGGVVRVDRISKKLATPYTPPELVEEIGIGEVRSILAFVNPEDPPGDLPPNPPTDPQYWNWQSGIEAWLRTHPLPPMTPPTEYDDVHIPEKQPRLRILLPENQDTIQSTEEIRVEFEAHFPIRELLFFINDVLVESRTNLPLSGSRSFPGVGGMESPEVTIKITAYDGAGNRGVVERRVRIRSPE